MVSRTSSRATSSRPIKSDRRSLRLALIGFGHVGQAFARLLLAKHQVLRDQYGLDHRITAITTAHHGWAVDEAGLDLASLLPGKHLGQTGAPPTIGSLPADILVEVSTLNPQTGQPALDSTREALTVGMHVVTSNKGPIAHGYRELETLARQHGRQLRFEATVADTLPVFNLKRYALPAATVRGVRGIVNSTTNYLLSQMAKGDTLAAALATAQQLGIAERDPSNDLEGWDAAVKGVILGVALMDRDLAVVDMARTPITADVVEIVETAKRWGKRVRAVLTINDSQASWGPVAVEPEDPLYAVDGFSMGLEIDTDVAGRLFVALIGPGVEQTAFALLSDVVDVGTRPAYDLPAHI